MVSTKLDTRLPQFARGSDVEMFLRPPGRLLEPGMLGGCPSSCQSPLLPTVGNAAFLDMGSVCLCMFAATN